mmetsp:Transcript_11074/g.12181  ORF Transcript_11074/g.12181 Transcript_11074/m.12181 type:complete len:163 (+) Transcript_11074:99-587(+)
MTQKQSSRLDITRDKENTCYFCNSKRKYTCFMCNTSTCSKDAHTFVNIQMRRGKEYRTTTSKICNNCDQINNVLVQYRNSLENDMLCCGLCIPVTIINKSKRKKMEKKVLKRLKQLPFTVHGDDQFTSIQKFPLTPGVCGEENITPLYVNVSKEEVELEFYL